MGSQPIQGSHNVIGYWSSLMTTKTKKKEKKQQVAKDNVQKKHPADL